MKVGILTFQNTLNFGAVLQCYGLYKTLQGSSYDVEVIDYRCSKVESREGVTLDGSLKTFIKRVLRAGKVRRFAEFASRMSMSERCDRSTFKNVSDRYDAIVVGSDQVWNPECQGYDLTYFLDQIDDKARKKSYAASIGLNHFPDCGFDFRALLDGFSSILVREQTAAKEIARYTDNPVEVVLDPTLLADPSVWAGFNKLPEKVKGKDYVLVYAISEFDDSLKAARKIAEERNLEIVQIQQYGLSRTSGAINLRNVSPEEYVALFKNAKCSVVSSFHGVCFSLISGIDFYYAVDGGSGTKSSRVFDLMKLLGVERRNVTDYLKGSAKPLDHALIETRLAAERKRSLELLLESLS